MKNATNNASLKLDDIQTMNTKQKNYLILAFAFYLFAQTYQQYILLFGPMKGVEGMHHIVLASIHPANIVRHVLVWFSMILVLPAFIILLKNFQKTDPVLSRMGMLFFSVFCLLEIGFRSVYLFKILLVDAKNYASANAIDQTILLPKFQSFFSNIELIYIPLLLSLLLGSMFLMLLSVKVKNHLITVAMAISVIQQLSRLSGYTSLKFLNVFNGVWYYILVFLTFSLLILGVLKSRK